MKEIYEHKNPMFLPIMPAALEMVTMWPKFFSIIFGKNAFTVYKC